jgi:two-component system sensor kinase FixL
VILNILNNAIDAIKEKADSPRLITIRTRSYKTDYINITIADTGQGINPRILKTLFQPFITTKEEGMGIGLSLCYNIIDKHGGKITVTTREHQGTIFHIIIPLRSGVVA